VSEITGTSRFGARGSSPAHWFVGTGLGGFPASHHTVDGGYDTSIWGSDDGAGWTEILTTADLLAGKIGGDEDLCIIQITPAQLKRYWSLHYDWSHPGGGIYGFGGIEYHTCHLYSTGARYLGHTPADGSGPYIPGPPYSLGDFYLQAPAQENAFMWLCTDPAASMFTNVTATHDLWYGIDWYSATTSGSWLAAPGNTGPARFSPRASTDGFGVAIDVLWDPQTIDLAWNVDIGSAQAIRGAPSLRASVAISAT